MLCWKDFFGTISLTMIPTTPAFLHMETIQYKVKVLKAESSGVASQVIRPKVGKNSQRGPQGVLYHLTHRTQLFRPLSCAQGTDAAQRQRLYLQHKVLRGLFFFSVLNEMLPVPLRKRPFQDQSPQDRLGWSCRPDTHYQGRSQSSRPTLDFPDQVENDILPKLCIVEEVSEDVLFDARPLIFASRHLFRFTTRVNPANFIRKRLVRRTSASKILSSMCGSVTGFSWPSSQLEGQAA